MSPTDDLVPILKKLRLSGVLETLELRTRQAVEDKISFEEFLVRLLGDEVERREGKQLRLRMARAQFEHGRTLGDFDFGFNPTLPRARILELAACGYIRRHESVLLVGPAGVGKVSAAPTPSIARRHERARSASWRMQQRGPRELQPGARAE